MASSLTKFVFFTPRTDNQFPLHDLLIELSGQIIPDTYDLGHVAEWEPYILHDL